MLLLLYNLHLSPFAGIDQETHCQKTAHCSVLSLKGKYGSSRNVMYAYSTHKKPLELHVVKCPGGYHMLKYLYSLQTYEL